MKTSNLGRVFALQFFARTVVLVVWMAPLLVHGAASAPPKEIAAKVPGDRRPVEIVGTEFNKEQAEATVTFRSSFGIFAFNLDLAGTRLTKLTFLIQKQKYCEGLDFRSKADKALDLRRAEGVKIAPRGEDLAIEITGPALAALQEGGRVQYINQYR
jgi:hypothetical protein